MNRFIYRFIWFLMIPILGYAVFVTIASFKASVYKLNPSVIRIFAGDSHIQLAINDDVIPKSANIALQSEAFFYSYHNLKKILATNSQVETIYLGFTYHSTSDYIDERLFGHNSNLTTANYFLILPPTQKLRLMMANAKDIVRFSKITLRHIVSLFLHGRYPNIGHFKNDVLKNTSVADSSMIKRINEQYFNHNGQPRSFAKVNLEYLTKIIEYCHKKSIRLVMLNTPLHQDYFDRIPNRFIEEYNRVINQSGVEVLNLANMPLTDDCFLPDGDHLSPKGANMVTYELLERLEDKNH